MPEPRRPDPAQGVFETLLVLDGHPVELDAHLARLEASLAELFPDHSPPPDLAELDMPEIGGRPGTSLLGSMRITVAPDGEGRLEAQTTTRDSLPGAFFGSRPNEAPTGIELRGCALPGGLGAHKWADRSLLDEAQAKLRTDTLPLIVESDGSVLEASRANVFAVRDGRLLTPPTDGRILPGITRMRVIEIATAMGMEAREATLATGDLFAADEVFLTGSVRGIERVEALDERMLARGGEVTAALIGELHRAWLGAKVG